MHPPPQLLTAPRILESSEKSEYKLVTLCLMRDHQLTGADPADLSRFTELRALDLDENYFEDLGALTELQFLRELHLGANALTSLQPLDPEVGGEGGEFFSLFYEKKNVKQLYMYL